MINIANIVIIGAGNVGTQLSSAFRDEGCKIVQVVGRREAAVKVLAEMHDADYSLSFSEVVKGQDLYLMALPDNAMEEILPQLGLTDELLVHTSGSLPLDILSNYSQNTGVFYPLQTFSQNRKIKISEVPLFIEANRIDNEDTLIAFGKRLSSNVNVADTDQRQIMHIAAVFASNFTNHMYDIARQLLEDHGFDFKVMESLILETAAKAMEKGPEDSQTGPAKRKDMNVIEKHLKLLKNNPSAEELYRRISQSIIDQTKSE